jgi:hypothetical protein
MTGFISKLGEMFSNTVGMGPYHRKLDSLMREEDRLTREGLDPEKSKNYQKLARECRELAHKHGIKNHPG